MDKFEIERLARRGAQQVINEMSGAVDRKTLPGGEYDGVPGGLWKGFGEFLHTVRYRPHDARLKDLAEGTDSAGGFLVPDEFRKQLLQDTIEASIVRKFATIVPMATDTINVPKVEDTSHASSVFGGMIAYWTEEAGAKTEAEPTFGRIKLIAKKLTTYTEVSDELLDDSAIALGALLGQMMSKTIAWFEDYAYLRGSGVGEPLGVFGSNARITPARAVASQISLADLANIWCRLLPGSQERAIWIANPATIAQLCQLTTSSLTWLSIDAGLAKAPPARLLGRPLYLSEKVPTLGETGDIGLYDLSYYLIGDRKGVKVDASEHYKFKNDQTCFRGVLRVDGEPWVDSAFTPKNGATLSPFVQLSSSTT